MTMLNEIREHLKNGIIPFWEGLNSADITATWIMT